ncbi:hypothetical protein [Streptacidiphilus sp. PAMC 29251]
MGIFDRLRGRGGAPGLPGASESVAAPAAAAVGGRPGWAGLPPIQRATARPARYTVASSDFAQSLTTWQNPSFSGTLSHAVLDGAPTGLIRGVLAPAVAGPSGGLGEPALSLPVAVEAADDVAEAADVAVQRTVSATRRLGPQVAPVRPRRAQPTPLTRAPAPAQAQHRVLPAATPASRPGGTPTLQATPVRTAVAPADSTPPPAPAAPGPGLTPGLRPTVATPPPLAPTGRPDHEVDARGPVPSPVAPLRTNVQRGMAAPGPASSIPRGLGAPISSALPAAPSSGGAMPVQRARPDAPSGGSPARGLGPCPPPRLPARTRPRSPFPPVPRRRAAVHCWAPR